MPRTYLYLLLAVLFFPLISSRAYATEENRIFVRLKGKVSAASIMSVASKVEGVKFTGSIPNSDVLVFSTSGNTDSSIKALKSQENVAAAVRVPVFRILEVNASDPYIPLQWGLANMKVDGSSSAWDLFGSNSNIESMTSAVVVGVLDTGADRMNPDLNGKVVKWVNCNGVPSCVEDSGTDDNGHGTHVSGIIAGRPDSAGIAGVGWGARIVAVKSLDKDGAGSGDAILNGMSWLADNASRYNMKVANLSVGLATEDPEIIAILQNAIDNMRSRGLLVVAAAGNCGDAQSATDAGCNYAENPRFYPAANNGVLSVAALDRNNNLAPYSEYNGNGGNWVSVAAPGGSLSSGQVITKENGILSTWLTSGACTLSKGGLPPSDSTNYCFTQGTSMASPKVAGLASLVSAINPALSADQIKAIIEQNADPAVISGKTLHGGVDAYASVLAAKNLIANPTVTPTVTSAVDPTVTPSGLPSSSPSPTVIVTVTEAPPTVTPSSVPSPTVNYVKCGESCAGEGTACENGYFCDAATGSVCRNSSCANSVDFCSCITPYPTTGPAVLPKTDPVPYPTGPYCPSAYNCALKYSGDADCNGVVDSNDLYKLKSQYGSMRVPADSNPNSNFVCVESQPSTYFIDLTDFENWRRNFFSPPPPTVSNSFPDLTVEDIARDADSYSLKYCNRGTAGHTGKFNMEVKSVGFSFQTGPVMSVPQAGSCNWTPDYTCDILHNICIGYVSVTAQIDIGNYIQESDETNNFFTKSFAGSPSPTATTTLTPTVPMATLIPFPTVIPATTTPEVSPFVTVVPTRIVPTLTGIATACAGHAYCCPGPNCDRCADTSGDWGATDGCPFFCRQNNLCGGFCLVKCAGDSCTRNIECASGQCTGNPKTCN